MTTATPTRRRTAPPVAAGPAGPLTGTGTLLRFMLRRDRIRLPAWVAGFGLFVPYFFTAFRTLFPSTEDLAASQTFTQGPVISMLGGPGYGMDESITYHSFFAGVYWLYFLLVAALLGILTVSRHTRVEEQTGRSELLRANVIGRHAPLTAALLLTAMTQAAIAVVLTAALVAFEAPLGDAALIGVGTAAVGLVFAGVTAITVQLSEYSRVASSMAGAALGAAFVIRAIGDTIREHGSALSWLSPFAWAQQTRPFVDPRWWPLAIALVAAVATAAIGFALSTRRDVGAGLWATRPGRPAAASWVRSPIALAWRLQRSGVRGWAIGLVLAGLVYGGTAQAIIADAGAVGQELTELLGVTEGLVDGYLALMVTLMSVVTGVYVVLALQHARAEELDGRAEPVLATATSKGSWLAGHLLVVGLSAVGLVTLASLATGLGAAASTGDWGHVLPVTVAGLAASPPVLVVLGVGAALYGLAARALTLTWVLIALGWLVEFFGTLLDLPDAVSWLSPWHHGADLPVESFEPLPVLALLAVAAVTALAGIALFRRRDLSST